MRSHFLVKGFGRSLQVKINFFSRFSYSGRGLGLFMSRRRKIFLWIIGSLICLTSLLVGFLLLLPYLINLEPIRDKIEALLFQQVGGKVEYRKIDLFYFPRPGVNAHQ